MCLIHKLIENHGPISKKELIKGVNMFLDQTVCNSTIEKDLFCLRMDFDIQYKHIRKKGYVLENKIDFETQLLNYIKVYV